MAEYDDVWMSMDDIIKAIENKPSDGLQRMIDLAEHGNAKELWILLLERAFLFPSVGNWFSAVPIPTHTSLDELQADDIAIQLKIAFLYIKALPRGIF